MFNFKKKSLIAISAVMLASPLATSQALADSQMPDDPQKVLKKADAQTTKMLNKAKEQASATTQKAEELAKGAIITMQEAVLDKKSGLTAASKISYHPGHSANNLIGSVVNTTDGEMLGVIKDILIDPHGKATHIVFANHNKQVAIEYDRFVGKKDLPIGNVMATINESAFESMTNFERGSFENAMSLEKLIDGEIIASSGKTMASIDDAVLNDGYVTYVIAGFDKFLGFGGKNAALSYGTGDLAIQNHETDIVLDEAETAIFKTYKETIAN